MKIILSVLILIFGLQSWSKANDISDFEIEGMSIGDSLLNYFSKVQIETNNIDKTKNRKFDRILILNSKSMCSIMHW